MPSNMVEAQCSAGYHTLKIQVNPDEYFNDVSWKVTNYDGTAVYGQGWCVADSLHVDSYCIPVNTCAIFTMYDEAGDGLTPNGYYKLYFNDSLIRQNVNYAYSDRTYFGCAPGEFCNNAFPTDTGLIVTNGAKESWYAFTPTTTGTYRLAACEGNACPTKIWVYDNCNNIFLSNNQTGAIFFAENGCENGAVATLLLQGGRPYYFRLGRADTGCINTPIHAKLTYEGSIRGCSDPNACNYQPLATVFDTCYYPGDPRCVNGPDLTILEDVLRSTMMLDTIRNPDQCAIDEGCLRGLGLRHVLKFSTHIKNIGNRDYFIGMPPDDPQTPTTQFVWDPCHFHWHYRGYAEYVLKNQAGNISVGTKNGFCVLDLECEDGGNPKFSCGVMGLSAQCGDIYDFALPCQWIDITGLSAGLYNLAVRVNWTQRADTLGQVETTYDNNVGRVCFRLRYNGTNPVIQLLDTDCDNYKDCLGVPLGNAIPDCKGICNGTNQFGDLNQDSNQDLKDMSAYLDTILAGNGIATPCNDAYRDSTLNIMDAASLMECVLHRDDPNYWGLRFACHFPVLPDNNEGLVYLYPGKLDTLAKTFDVRILNTPNRVSAFEFNVAGLVIDSIKNLTQFKGDIRFNQQGKIIGLATGENFMERHQIPGNMLRIYYKQLTAPKVCVQSVTAVANNRYKAMAANISVNNCVATSAFVSNEEPGFSAFSIVAQPNPLYERTTLYFNNPLGYALQLELTDLAGRPVKAWKDIRNESLEILRENLPAGVYWMTVTNGTEKTIIKLLFI